MLENKMVLDDYYIENDYDYEGKLEHLLELDDEYYENEIFERLNEED